MAKRKPKPKIVEGRTETFGGRYRISERIREDAIDWGLDWGETTLRDCAPVDVRDTFVMFRSFESAPARAFVWELATLCAKHLAETRGDGPTVRGRPKITCKIAADLVAKQIDTKDERQALQPLVEALRNGEMVNALHLYQATENFYAELIPDDVIVFLGG